MNNVEIKQANNYLDGFDMSAGTSSSELKKQDWQDKILSTAKSFNGISQDNMQTIDVLARETWKNRDDLVNKVSTQLPPHEQKNFINKVKDIK